MAAGPSVGSKRFFPNRDFLPLIIDRLVSQYYAEFVSDKRRSKGQETQQKLLQGVFELAAESGLQGVTASKLAKRVGVSTSTIFHHFPTIEALTLAAMRSWFDGFMHFLEAPPPQPPSLSQHLEQMGQASFDMLKDAARARATMAFIHHALFDSSYRDLLAPMLEEYALVQRRLLAQASGRDESDPEVESWTCALSSALDGLATQAIVTQDLPRCQRAWSTLRTCAEQALANDTRGVA